MDTFALRTDGGTQPRERLDEATVERYAEAMTAGSWDFGRSSDPAVAFYDGTEHWLSDGFHRLAAAKRAGKLDEFSACLVVRQGTVRDAILYSVGANAHHGFPRSDNDKRRAVSRLLGDPEWSKWSDREIARRCYVTHPFVSKLRAVTGTVSSERTYTTKHGTVATMDTSAIGRAGNSGPVDGPPDDLVTITMDEWDDLAQKAREAEKAAGAGNDLHTEPGDDPRCQNITTEPVGELRTDAAGADRASDGFCAYHTMRGYLDTRRPSLPSQAAVDAMTAKNRATIRRLAEQSRAWAVGLLDLLDTAGDSNA